MRKILLLFIVACTYSNSHSQVVCAGVSPANIQGNYTFSVQTDFGWPRYNGFGGAASENWGLTMDFSIPGTFIMDTLVLVNDGTPGTSADYGHLSAEEGCNPSTTNAYAGKIAVLRRGACAFTTKAKYAQDQGAVAVIVVDHSDDPNLENNYMSAGATSEGPSVTIPVVRISRTDGNNIIAAMQTNDVVMFIGNKLGAFPNDIGTNIDEILISPYEHQSSYLDNGFSLGTTLINYGSSNQTNVTVQATIDGPSGNVYNQSVVVPTLNAGDTLYIFEGEPYSLPAFDLGGVGYYEAGEYTLTYSLIGAPDDFTFDNQYVSNFTINESQISLSRLDNTNMPIATSFPVGVNKPEDYHACMYFSDPNGDNIQVDGLSFVPYADTSVADLYGAEILINVYEWASPWTDLNDPTYWGASASQDPWVELYFVHNEGYYPNSNDETGLPAYAPFSTPFLLNNDTRYLFCLNSYDTNVVFGFDGDINYDGNQWVRATPISPIKAEDANNQPAWYVGGWNSVSALSMSLNVSTTSQAGIKEDEQELSGKVFPNPSSEVITIAVNGSGKAVITATDLSGREMYNHDHHFENGKSALDISNLSDGVYLFNIELEDGRSTQLSVVKN